MSTYNNEAEIADRIRKRRIELGLTQAQVANKIQVSVSNYNPYEKHGDGKIPNLFTLGKIAKALNTSMDYLYFGTEGELPSPSKTEGRIIVDSFCYLLDVGVIDCDASDDENFFISKHAVVLRELYMDIAYTNAKKSYYGDFERTIEERKDAAAREIDEEILIDNACFGGLI